MKKKILFVVFLFSQLHNCCENNNNLLTTLLVQNVIKYPWLCMQYNLGCTAFKRTTYAKITREKTEPTSIEFTTKVRTTPHPFTGEEHPLMHLNAMRLQDAYTQCIQEIHDNIIFLKCTTSISPTILKQLLSKNKE